MELVIMAAGMGSRFGGLKQIEPIDKNGSFIIDYSIYDAIKCGFEKVVFIIKEENYNLFRETIGKRIENKIKVEYVFQKGLNVNPNRIKPWGTAHAILSCKNVVKDNFAIINADDFYAYDAFKTVSKYLKNCDKTSSKFALVGYKAISTMTENGATKRGVCEIENDYLVDLVESSLELKNGKIFATPLDSPTTTEIPTNTIVSTNMFALTPKVFELLEEELPKFLENNKNNLDKCEFLIPTEIGRLIKEKKASVEVLKTTATWLGVTYKEDKPMVVNSIAELVKNKVYPTKLWN